MNEERDSQLSAMFDGELPGSECELLARRLTRDEALRSMWSRYAMIGAALRAERGVALHDRVAWRVQSVIAQETTYAEGAEGAVTAVRTAAIIPADAQRRAAGRRWMRIARPLVGAGIAASVAVMSVVWLRVENPEAQVVAAAQTSQSIVLVPEANSTTVAMNPVAVARPAGNGEPDRYVTPAPSSQTSIAPPARLANYVFAHSEYSGPLSRRMALLGLVASENGEAAALPETTEGTASTDTNDAP